ncbi:unnamed protein product [Linum trigynum]|uniref:Uncharacterized protein n=1 Tax=Linum trigynum TaxID=586398 RepID=A0AAV2E101_9ROSI
MGAAAGSPGSRRRRWNEYRADRPFRRRKVFLCSCFGIIVVKGSPLFLCDERGKSLFGRVFAFCCLWIRAERRSGGDGSLCERSSRKKLDEGVKKEEALPFFPSTASGEKEQG